MLFKKGVAVKRIEEKEFIPVLLEEINMILEVKKEV
jgi:hypothetical protein